MRKELRRYSSIGSRNGILLFCSKILTGELENISSIQTACAFILEANINFKCALALFEDLGLVRVQGDVCISTEIVFNKASENDFIISLCERCINYIINENLVNLELLRYDECEEQFYIPSAAFSLDSALLRNLIKELSAISLKGTKFYIAQDYEHLFRESIQRKKTLDQTTLMKIIEDERKMGEEGELFVLNFEKRRLHADEYHKKNIKQISLIDVSAGYDILSYHDENCRHRRYIEVKTYKGDEHFYWSSNEIKSAKLRGEDYFIYLVNYTKISIEDYTPLMIANPFRELQINNSWNATPDSYFIERVRGKKKEDSQLLFAQQHPVPYTIEEDIPLPIAAEEETKHIQLP